MPKKTPIRTCIACGAQGDKRDFVRIVRSADGTVSLDETGRKAGRGAYLCRNMACFEKAAKKRLFDTRLKQKVSEEDRNRLEAEFGALCSSAEQAQ